MRGEHVVETSPLSTQCGSSPHARGTPDVYLRKLDDFGFIPACAGNTSPQVNGRSNSAAHPRMRGEHWSVCQPGFRCWGSPPHARGTRRAHLTGRFAHGLTPACAGNTAWLSSMMRLVWAHPRMRGEHNSVCVVLVSDMGSPPHARGTLHRRHRPGTARGLTPACAGNTLRLPTNSRGGAAHPRMRGEHPGFVTMVPDGAGSPPHARGTRAAAGRYGRESGLTPACAGNTAAAMTELAKGGAHPRMRGEHTPSIAAPAQAGGSPPHARGTRYTRHPDPNRAGLIPACAGNTERMNTSQASTRAHPRMRGEHPTPTICVFVDKGSSPHARGTPSSIFTSPCGMGLTPACAGNTCAAELLHAALGAHPRMRGEHGKQESTTSRTTGSSPHARGTPFEESGLPVGGRLIPACAGNTLHVRGCGRVRRAHPRMRGEHVSKPFTVRLEQGSSPHARGTLPEPVDLLLRQRLIPACAGNTFSKTPRNAARGAHPRMRGEHVVQQKIVAAGSGSSPHARGTQLLHRPRTDGTGLIPACAGNTLTH